MAVTLPQALAVQFGDCCGVRADGRPTVTQWPHGKHVLLAFLASVVASRIFQPLYGLLATGATYVCRRPVRLSVCLESTS